jgi:TBC1 domain family member 2
MTSGVDEWSRDPTEDDEDEDDEIVYDDDEDEFGLPSLASMRRKKTPSSSKTKNIDPGGALGGIPGSLGFGLSSSNRQRANSSDIAEERGTPMYPTARKGEGKILRPQYKDILQGLQTFTKLDHS